MEFSNIKILTVGLSCVDIVQTCKYYPLEDCEQKSVEYKQQRGGNSSNTCTVLSLLGNLCEFLGVFSAEEHTNFLQNDMKKYNIDFSHCPEIKGVGCPVSTVILSLSTGTRTILHYNPNLPELTLKDFMQLKLQNYSWIHFEGRNITELLSMMQNIESYNKSMRLSDKQNIEKSNKWNMTITISLEIEKSIPELLDLLSYVDIVFISKDFARSRGYNNMSETLKNISAKTKPGTIIICAWSDRGAMACISDGVTVQSPAFPPQKIIDSLGAGDTFNAGVIHYLNKVKISAKNKDKGSSNSPVKKSQSKKHDIENSKFNQTEFIDQNILQAAITFACHVAGTKIGMKGYDGLDKIFTKFE
ncbi:ketohexokinase-like [Vespa crabro]|uniref:ketohexokinase-like n=1 Tax=Vespa crabro TaxID=7445 RepID=UPI001EFFC32A|nr:ketohexokinase-like [Vespa crabro]